MVRLEYLDFEIEVSPGNRGEYPVSVRSSPAGETPAPEIMRLPFDQQGLEIRLKDLENALLRSSAITYRVIPSKKELVVRDFGQELFSALIIGEVRNRYSASRGIANNQQKGLRIKLHIRAPELSTVPWEFLYDPGENRYVCLSIRTPIVRYLNLPQPPSPMAVSPPLRILGMAVSPPGAQPLAVEQEKKRMSEAIRPLQESGLVELVWIKGNKWYDLQLSMQRGPWHVFHFIGHGGFDSEKKQGGILLGDDDGAASMMYASQLALLLGDHISLRLVLLNSCEGATSSSQDLLSSTAAILMTQGIPAVLAMQYEISDKAAIYFSQAFYGALANGLPVDTAVTEGRKAIQVGGGNTVEWGTPVLCMRSPDGVVFKVSQLEDEQRKRKKVSELFDLALKASASNDWENALGHLQSVLALDPGHKDANEQMPRIKTEYELSLLYAEAKTSYEQHKWQEALKLFQQLHNRRSDYRDVNSLMTVCHEELKPKVDPVAESQRVSTTSPAPDAHPNRVRLLQVVLGVLILGIAGVGLWWFLKPNTTRNDDVQPPGGQKQGETEKKVDHSAVQAKKFDVAFEFIEFAFSSDGKKLAYVGDAAEVYQEAPGSSIRLSEKGERGRLYSVAVSPDGEMVASGETDGKIWVWQLGSKEPRIFPKQNGRVFLLSFSNDGQTLMSASAGPGNVQKSIKTVTIWRTANGEQIRQPELTGAGDTILAINATKGLVALETANHELQLWSLSNDKGANKTSIQKNSNTVFGAFDSNGQWLAVADESKDVRVWRVDNSDKPNLKREMKPYDLAVGSLAFGSKHGLLAVGWDNGPVNIWLPPFTDAALAAPSQKGSVTLAIDDNGDTLAEGRSDSDSGPYSITLWRIKKE